MRSPAGSPYGSRRPSSDGRSTPDRRSAYSQSSAASSRASDPGLRRTPGRSGLSRSSGAASDSGGGFGAAVKALAGSFVACFKSPAGVRSGRDGAESEELRGPSASSGISASSRRTALGKGANVITYNSTQNNMGGAKFAMEEIHKVTRNFSPSHKIGQGGFGTVYKGRLADGTPVAIKRAKKVYLSPSVDVGVTMQELTLKVYLQTAYDKHLNVEFQSEVRTLAQIEHLNLVRFFGYLEDEGERIVVVEYVPNGTLREHLDGLRETTLDLAARLDIAIDVAHAITYLHMYAERPIIHRDIKSSNILLTENLRAKVADFGFARLAETDTGVTHVSTQVKGTAGYLDPEYLRTYQLTEKSDVYSFGVLLVEMMSGRRPIEAKRELKERITAKWAVKKFNDGDGILVLDPRLPRSPATNLALEKMLELALECLAPSRHSRPTMKQCAEILWSIRKDYRELVATDLQPLASQSQQRGSIREK